MIGDAAAHQIVYKALHCRTCYAQLYIFVGKPLDVSRYLLLVLACALSYSVEYRGWADQDDNRARYILERA